MAKRSSKTNDKTRVFLIIRNRATCIAMADELNQSSYDATDYQTAREFLIDKRNHESGVVVAELRMLDTLGTELAIQLADEREKFPVVLIVNDADTPKAVKAGVDFICVPVSPEKIIAAVERTKQPEVFRERDMRWLFDRMTPMEWRVFEFVMAGLSSREIGAAMGISNKTVEAHRARINDKSRCTDVGQLIRMWKAWQDLQ